MVLLYPIGVDVVVATVIAAEIAVAVHAVTEIFAFVAVATSDGLIAVVVVVTDAVMLLLLLILLMPLIILLLLQF